MIKFPQPGTPIIQAPKGNLQGSLWSTFNIDLQENPGRIRLGRKLNVVTSTADDADMTTAPCAFEFFGGSWWAIAGTKIFKNEDNSLATTFTEVTSSGVPTTFGFDDSDLCTFNNRLWATTDTGLYSTPSSVAAWTERDGLSAAVVKHKMAFLRSTNRLYYVDDAATISSIDENDTVANSAGSYYLDLGVGPFGNSIKTIIAFQDNIFASVLAAGNSGASHSTDGYVYVWNGIDSTVQSGYKINTSGIRAFASSEDNLYAVDTGGRFMRYTGYGFEEIARLPYNNIPGIGSTDDSSSDRGFNIDPNGLQATPNQTLLCLVNSRKVSGPSPLLWENVPSGVWEVDLKTGSCTHKHSITYKGINSTTVTDFGQYRVHSVGALKLQTVNGTPDADTTLGTSTLACGVSYYSDSGTTTADGSAIFALTGMNASTIKEEEKRGYFVTTWIDSGDMQDTWQKIGIKHRKYLDSDDKIVAKYRTTEADPTYADITWTSTTTFTTTTDISSYWTSGTGGEVEITQGPGGGVCAHITNITNNAGTYTVTIDEIATGVANGNTAVARFQSWIKIAALTQQNLEHEVNALGVSSERIQFKVVMHFTGDGEFHQMQVSNKPHIKLD